MTHNRPARAHNQRGVLESEIKRGSNLKGPNYYERCQFGEKEQLRTAVVPQIPLCHEIEKRRTVSDLKRDKTRVRRKAGLAG